MLGGDVEVPVVAAVSTAAGVSFPFQVSRSSAGAVLIPRCHSLTSRWMAGVGLMGVLAALVEPESSAGAVSLLADIAALSTSTNQM